VGDWGIIVSLASFAYSLRSLRLIKANRKGKKTARVAKEAQGAQRKECIGLKEWDGGNWGVKGLGGK